ncbi:hypothetical protein [Blastococcus sp. SYSU DS0539]
MRARSPAQARFLGLWTAGWLAGLLVAGMVRFGDPAVQWPVLLVPALWALIAVRPRRSSRAPARGWADDDGRHPGTWDEEAWDEGAWDEGAWDGDARRWPPPGERTDTVERPALRRRADDAGERW